MQHHKLLPILDAELPCTAVLQVATTLTPANLTSDCLGQWRCGQWESKNHCYGLTACRMDRRTGKQACCSVARLA